MVAAVIIIAVAIVCAGMIYDINKRFPAAEVEIHTSDAPLEIDGLILTPGKSQVYTCEAYTKAYEGAPGLSGIKEEAKESVRVVVLSMTVDNPTNDSITFRPEFSTFEGLKSCVNNGVIRIWTNAFFITKYLRKCKKNKICNEKTIKIFFL